MPLKIAAVGNDFNSFHPVFTRGPQALDEAAAELDLRSAHLHFFRVRPAIRPSLADKMAVV